MYHGAGDVMRALCCKFRIPPLHRSSNSGFALTFTRETRADSHVLVLMAEIDAHRQRRITPIRPTDTPPASQSSSNSSRTIPFGPPLRNPVHLRIPRRSASHVCHSRDVPSTERTCDHRSSQRRSGTAHAYRLDASRVSNQQGRPTRCRLLLQRELERQLHQLPHRPSFHRGR